jgi:hypothetical protein
VDEFEPNLELLNSIAGPPSDAALTDDLLSISSPMLGRFDIVDRARAWNARVAASGRARARRNVDQGEALMHLLKGLWGDLAERD